MADQELRFRISADGEQAKVTIAELKGIYGNSLSEIVRQAKVGAVEISKAQAQAAAEAKKTAEEDARTQEKNFQYIQSLKIKASRDAQREAEAAERAQTESVLSLQRQRSAALISEWQKTEAAAKKSAEEAAKGITTASKAFDAEMQRIGNVAKNTFLEVGQAAGLGAKDMAALAATAPVVVGGFVLATGATVGLGAAVYSLSNYAGEAGDRIYQLHVKTGLEVETVSALDIAMQRNGKSADDLSAALVFLDKQVEAANEKNPKAKKNFDDLGVSYANNEVALRGLIKRLSEIQDPGQRAAESVKFFGRSGAEMNKVIEESHGDFDLFMEKLRESNELMSGESAQAAHDYEVKLRDLGIRWDVLKRQLGEEFIPHLSLLVDALTNAGGTASKQAGAFSLLGDAINHDIDDVRNFIEYLNAFKETGDPVTAFMLASKRGADAVQQQQLTQALASITKNLPGSQGFNPESLTPDFGGREREGIGGTTAKDDPKVKEAKAAAEITTANLKIELDKQKDLYEQHQITVETFTKRKVALAEQEHKAVLDSIEAQRKAIAADDEKRDEKLARISVEEARANMELAGKRLEARSFERREEERQRKEDERKAKEERDAEFRDLQKQHTDALELQRINAQNALFIVEEYEREGSLSHKQASDARIEADRFEHTQRLEMLKVELERAKALQQTPETITALEHQIDVETRLVEVLDEESDVLGKRATLQDTKDRLENVAAILKQHEAQQKLDRFAPLLGIPEGALRGKFIPPKYDSHGGYHDPTAQAGAALGVVVKDGGLDPPPPTKWQVFSQAVRHSIDEARASIGSFGDVATSVLHNVEEGVLSNVQAWILYGGSAVAAMRSLAAGVIAELVKVAIVHAAHNIAEGFEDEAKAHAAAASGNVASAALYHAAAITHWLAAAKWGGVAAVGAIVGRAVAGGGAGSSAGAGVSSTGVASPQPNDRTFNYGGTSTPSSSVAQAGTGNLFRDIRDIANHVRQMGTASPGSVVTMGAPEASQAIGVAVLQHSASDGSFAPQIGRDMGFAR